MQGSVLQRMEFSQTERPVKTLHWIISLVLVQFLFTFAQGQGPGNARENFSVVEESPPGTFVGKLQTQPSYSYRFQDDQALFSIDSTSGNITTKVSIDRESLAQDTLNILVLGSPPAGSPIVPIDIYITVLDINDNSPKFPQSEVTIKFPEKSNIGDMFLLDTATDLDSGQNGNVTNYQIISRDDDNKFETVFDPANFGQTLRIKLIGELDREERDKYHLNISVQDNGSSPKFGYLSVKINIEDVNDNPPVFPQSQFVASVNESTPVGTTVIHIEANDRDIGRNGEVTYTMDESSQFTIDSKTGEIITKTSPLVCHSVCLRSGTISCHPNSCILTVEARDNGVPPLNGRAYVSIHVKDENDHAPTIVIDYLNSGKNLSVVNENAADGKLVAIVTVSDSDSGLYGNISSFEIASGNELNHFRVSHKLELKYNLIQVNGNNVLDRERKSLYNFTLKAVDRGSPPKSSLSNLLIYVNDVNDHKPEFKSASYTASLSETVPEGSFVANLIATDQDSGVNAALTYDIVSGNVNQWFKIDTTSGLVTTASVLDFSKASRTVLNVSVHDGGATPFYDHTTLTITIWDENNMVPTFDKSEITVSVEEGLLSGINVWTAVARDTDSGVNGSVVYRFSDEVGQMYPGTFSLNSQTGEIKTTKSLDREAVASYVLHVIASDQAARPLSSTATLHINVEDKNDNTPYFYPQKYYENVDENSPIGTTVVMVRAFDADLGDNGRIYYSFTQRYPQFSINQTSGAVTTTQVLRKALKSSYTLLVTCRDTNTAHRADPNAIVEIMVTDGSDVAPSFGSGGYRFTLTEDVQGNPSLGRVVGTVAATSATTYAISGGNERGTFTIDSQTGRITTNKTVDREVQAFYVLKVVASGRSKYASTDVEITVTDVNDNAPVFERSTAEVEVYENWPVEQDVYHAVATDIDTGVNSLLSYSMQSTSDLFKIRPNSGLVYLARNKEKADGTIFTMTVKVTDSGSQQKTASASVTIIIVDVNDHTPVFPKYSYEISLNESIHLNSQFYSLTATDADQGKNAEITYNITRGNSEGKFGIFPDGNLYVAKELDRETRDLYKLTVLAKDKGDDPRSSSVNITIHITDANDNRPLFQKTSYQFQVAENLPAGQKIGYIRAQDADVGRNSELSYFLSQASNHFAIDVQTGEVTTLRMFDRELLLNQTGQESYHFEAVVFDNGIPALQDKASITVTILDENDNAPHFTEPVYKARLSEDAAIYSPVVTVKAVDLDKDENGAVTYEIVQGNEDGKFDIHPTTGLISLNGSIDMEQQKSYSMVVMGTDTGKSQKFNSTAIVNVFLLDVNDNTPSFDQTSYSVRIPEDMEVGAQIPVKMVATDVDMGVNAEISFTLSGSGNDGTFIIDSHTGKLYLAREVNFERKRFYQMTVVATDKGAQLLSSDAILTINIDDVNDNGPEFQNIPSVVDVLENSSPFSSILQLSASDADTGLNGQFSFNVAVEDPPENMFTIQNGNLLLERTLDRERTPFYHLTIAATDLALPESTRKTTEKTIIVRVTDVNDNVPRFTSPNAIMISYPTSQGKVGTIRADDPDSEGNGRIIYSLVSGDDKFDLGSSSGELYLTQNLPQTPTRYTIRVRATDQGSLLTRQSSEMDIAILLHQSTRSGPTFQNLPYSKQVVENSASGNSVFRVSSSAQSVEYYICGVKSGDSDVAQYFVIEKNSGIMRTQGTLDREVVGDSMMVTVCAVDVGAAGPAVSTAQVSISILDQNDTPPRFNNNSYSLVLSEETQAGAEILKMAVTDPDTQGSSPTLRIRSGNDDNLFTVDNSGSLKITRRLDRERKSHHRLLVEATDGANTAQVTVSITVTDTNDNAPSFTQSFYSFDVPEDSPRGTILARVEAEDPDEGTNGEITYSLASTWAQNVFQLNQNTGTITLASEVDFEQTHLYTVTVTAQDRGTSPRSSSVLVYLNVKDVNDNAPVFDPQSYNAEVMENVVLGTSVLKVSATDIDSGLNSKIVYSIVDGDLREQFGIGEENGTVFTIGDLDRETTDAYDLVVMATDQAEPSSARKSTTTTVTITVKDINDCPPEFTTPPFMYVRENTPVGNLAFTVSADDKDIGTSGSVRFSLSAHPAFTLTAASGDVFVKTPLDREKVQNYTLQVTATDEGTPSLSTQQTIVVYIEDENDNSPIFSPDSYFTTCSEDVKIGKSLLQVTASDADHGLNGIVRFFIIEGDANADFSMDPSSGVLRVQKYLDYERVQSYSITVRAEDSGMNPRYSTAKLLINVIDVNDKEPVFVDSPYNAFVRENMDKLPVFVAQLSARDDDSPPYSRLTYGLREGNSTIFQVNSTSGEVTCHRALDREATAEYKLVVVAIDSGSNRLTGIGTVHVMVQDVNDNAPQFDRSSAYIGHVAENRDTQTEILSVHASDADYGQNADITYKLLDSLDGRFAIIANTGKILTQRSLDREEFDHYQLTVIAEDHGNIPMTTRANVTVYVDDVNDNSPEFERPSYHQTLNNPTLTGQFVIGVTALDRDIGNNGRVEYSLIGTDAGKFDIDKDRGIVTAKEQLGSATYRCLIRAVDKGIPALTSSVELSVNMSSYSASNNPTFTSPESPVMVNESVAIGTVISTVSATAANGGSVIYAIAGGNINNAFSIDPTSGVIKVAGVVDYEMTHDFHLWIQAKDAGNEFLSAYQKIIINVNDLNDNTPRFEKNVYDVQIREEVALDNILIQILATDADDGPNGRVGYVIADGNIDGAFSINAVSGLIKTANRLDRETHDHYDLVIKATDQGSIPLTGSTTVRITLEDINDNAPKFSQIFSAQIPEDAPIGSFVVQVTSSDADIGINARTNYSIQYGGGMEMKFAIDGSSGNITLSAPLDAEELYRLTNKNTITIPINAYDGSFKIGGRVTIFVTDVNDNTPQLIAPTSFSVMEHARVNTPVGHLNATDGDVTNNQVYFSLKLPSSDFALNDQTGEITTKSELSYVYDKSFSNAVNQRELVVIVTDLGIPARSSESIVTINILDANDNAPVFEEDLYYSAVPENSVQGQEILQVVAKDDLDFGENAEIEYTIESGNGSTYFSVIPDTGMVVVGTSLQGQRGQTYALIIRASDKGVPPLSDTTTVKLTVTGVNQHAPQFTSNVFQVTIPENAGIGQSIAQLEASDSDGSGLNVEITYHILGGNGGRLFIIDERRGILSVNAALDFDTVPVHVLNISARDSGLHYKETTVKFTVMLSDVNDNPPVFNQTSYDAYIAEGIGIGRTVATVTATDKDSGSNAKIEYYFSDVQASFKFIINKDTGIITTKAPLDYETESEYSVLIIARNPGNPQMKSSTRVTVHVTGVNEYSPRFALKEYTFSTKESAPNGTGIGNITATDQDGGADGMVYYYLIGASNLKGFSVHYKTGEIYVSGKPDYESSPQVVLTALAKNWGSIKGNDTDTCIVRINVQDANDPPEFSAAYYQAHVQENSGADVSVVTVTAVDKDHNPSDKQFSYTILGGNEENLFKIDPTSGIVRTTGNGILDRERIPIYNVTVGAVDTGSPPATGSATVQIHLRDVNDNGPEFNPADLTGSVIENSSPGTFVLNLTQYTTDPDLPPNQGPYQYYAISDHPAFQIGANGVVKTKKPLDRETTPKYNISVRVLDNGNPTMSSVLTFFVEVMDDNDNPPQPRNMNIQVALYSSGYPTEAIADIRPNDVDIVGSYTCSVSDGGKNLFFVQSACDLHIRGRPTQPSYTISVNGSDGKQSALYTANVTFVELSDSASENMVILHVSDIEAATFMVSKFSNFKSSLDNLDSNKVMNVFNIVELDQTSDVLIIVGAKDIAGNMISHDALKQLLISKKAILESEADIKISQIGYSVCNQTLCNSANSGECLSRVSVGSQFGFLNSPSFILSSPLLVPDYRCNCPPQLTGSNCQIPVNPCGSGYCLNGGTCQNNAKCQCPLGWEGDFCQTDKDECAASPCQNEAPCQNLPGSYLCLCKEGFTGKNCETGSNNCAPNPCKNGGVCRNELNGYKCECPYIYWGGQCEFASHGFQEGSYMKFQSLDLYQRENSFDITFATTMPNGLLLYNPASSALTKDYVALEIIDSEIHFAFNLGDPTATKLTVKRNVTTGDWFRVEIIRISESASMKVRHCPSTSEECAPCTDSDPSCHAQGSQQKNVLNLDSHPLLIGGVDNLATIENGRGQIQTHDFVGCVRSFVVNTEEKLTANALVKEKITPECPRSNKQGQCSLVKCQNGGECMEEWSQVYCKCPAGFGGDRCEIELQPLSFGLGSYVSLVQRESYRRDQLVSGSSSRKRRSTAGSNVVMIRFRPVSQIGVLLVVKKGDYIGLLWVNEGRLTYSIIQNNNTLAELSLRSQTVKMSTWQNATVSVQGQQLSISLDEEQSTSTSKDVFEFSDPYITSFTVGGSENHIIVNGKKVKDYNGCLSVFQLDGSPMSLYNGTTKRFKIIRSDKAANTGCKQLCTSCSRSDSCAVEGESVVCSPVKQSPDEDSLSIGVIVVIAFFGVLLIVIGVIFVIFRMRRQRTAGKSDHNKNTKIQGNGHLNKSYTNNSPHSGQDSGYGDQDFMQHTSTHYNNGVQGVPDLINQQRRSPMPYQIDGSTTIIENGDIQLNSLNEDMPEHYDIDAASSIAPSDIDGVSYYRDYRRGIRNDLNYHQRPHKHSSSSRTSRESPAGAQHFNSKELPPPYGALKQQTAHMRHSPANRLEVPNSGSPAYPGVRNSPINQLSRQSPQVRASPLTHSNLRGTPIVDVQHSRTDSEHSLASHHSRSSTSSSVPRTALPNGHVKHGRHQKEYFKPHTPHKGLTKEEIDKLNARPQRPSPVSMLEAVSSSSEGIHHHNHQHNHLHPDQALLMPPDSSSEDSANDSFTCSEFEYENDKNGRSDFSPSAMIFSKLPEADETGDSHISPKRSVNSDGLDSNGGSFASTVASSEGGEHAENKPINGQFNWDYLLNWGPSFEKLVGVFQDIASLPEGDEALEGTETNDNREEYV